jgi:predicted regulator of Ras-like GTPase activity (Roadblock/LC7/MglB family)
MIPEGNMVENFRSRMGDLRQEMDRIASQAEELERIVQEQQVRLEEMDLLVRQRDEQLAEQQAHVEEMEATLRRHDEEVSALRAQLAEKEQALADKEAELAALRTRLSEYEAAEAALREELAQFRQAPPAPVVEVPLQTLVERFAGLEGLVNRQGESLAALRSLIETEMARLHGRLDHLEARLAAPPAVPPPITVAPVEVPPPVVAAPVEVALPTVVEAAPPPVPLVVAEADSLQTVLQDTLEMLPAAALVGLAGRDGLVVEMLVRREPNFAQPLELELADLATEATRVAAALNTGPLLTMAFQSGDDHVLLSPVGAEHFAYLLTPTDSPADFQQAQAVLLQAVSRLNEVS